MAAQQSGEVSGREAVGPGGDTRFSFRARPYEDGALAVVSFRGREKLSRCYAFDVLLAADPALVDAGALEADLLGVDATLRIEHPTGSRTIHGIVSAFRIEGTRAQGDRVALRVRLVPRLWLLGRRRNSRVFQHVTVREIVDTLLDEARLPRRWALVRTPPAREYCVQYEETDLAFVTRILAEAGITFYFGPPDPTAQGAAADAPPGETLHFCDVPTGFPAIPDASGARPPSPRATPRLFAQAADDALPHAPDEALVRNFALRRAVKFESATFRTHDPTAPTVDHESRAVASPAPGHEREAAPRLDAQRQEFYEHHNDYLAVQWRSEKQEGAQLLQQLRRAAYVARGEADTPRLAPGHRFALADHPVERLDGEYLLARVEHVGEPRVHAGAEGLSGGEEALGTGAYRNAFECVPAHLPHPPARPARKTVQVCETATVVGPAGEEVYTNELGHVRVQFHWDRVGGRDEHSSCWLRTTQAWAGPQWGAQFVPRVGMEVLVAFEGGDVDRPIVVGCVYHRAAPPPFELPREKTRSGIRTRSTPASEGYNELSFEDEAGREQVYLRAERDLDVEARRDRTARVGRNEDTRVEGDQLAVVRGDRAARVEGREALEVHGGQTVRVFADRAQEVHGHERLDVTRDLATHVGGHETRTVMATREDRVLEDLTVRVRGCLTTIVGRADAPRSYALHVEGSSSLESAEETEIVSDRAVVLRCGKSTLRLGPEGIELVAPEVSLRSSGASVDLSEGRVVTRARDAVRAFGDSVLLKSSGAGVALSGDARVAGERVRLGARVEGEAAFRDDAPEPTRIELTDRQGRALPHRRFEVRVGDRAVRMGITDKDGRAELYIEGEARVVFPDVAEPEMV